MQRGPDFLALSIAMAAVDALLPILPANRALPAGQRVEGTDAGVADTVSGVTIAFARAGVVDGVGLL
ncbi:hypothetical protein [Methylobacterium sp. P5_C11]